MKLLHCSDLHIGKRVNGFSMLPDQQKILGQIVRITQDEKPGAVLIAGDVYDKTIPSAEAVELFDWFLTRLAEQAVPVFFISGNHDSPERLDYAGRILQKQGVYVSGCYQGKVDCYSLCDEYGPVHIYLLPFIKPAMVNAYREQRSDSYHQAVKEVLAGLPVSPGERNVLIAHQFVVAGGAEPERSDSETLSLGGIDQVDASVFDGFDYVALGHLHGPQRIGRDTIRYSGSPLKYSFSECRQHKSICMVELGEKGTIKTKLIELTPARDMRKIKGKLRTLLSPEVAGLADPEDYLHVTLTDEETVIDAIGKLRHVYPNVMQIEFENRRQQAQGAFSLSSEAAREADPFELFQDFYEAQNNQPMSESQQELVRRALAGNREEAR